MEPEEKTSRQMVKSTPWNPDGKLFSERFMNLKGLYLLINCENVETSKPKWIISAKINTMKFSKIKRQGLA